jgi:hypothetical protein
MVRANFSFIRRPYICPLLPPLFFLYICSVQPTRGERLGIIPRQGGKNRRNGKIGHTCTTTTGDVVCSFSTAATVRFFSAGAGGLQKMKQDWIRYRYIREFGERGNLVVRLIIHLPGSGLFKAELNSASLRVGVF